MAQRSSLSQRRAALEQEWSRWIPAGTPQGDSALRSEVAQSWLRSLRTVDPSCEHAPVADADVTARWAASSLRTPVSELTDQLRDITEGAGYVAAITDETGTILWSHGGPVMRRRAEQVNFAPGGR
ncbi:hypothetical protein ABZW96_19275 [Nocardia sp. NPDC004168]